MKCQCDLHIRFEFARLQYLIHNAFRHKKNYPFSFLLFLILSAKSSISKTQHGKRVNRNRLLFTLILYKVPGTRHSTEINGYNSGMYDFKKVVYLSALIKRSAGKMCNQILNEV